MSATYKIQDIVSARGNVSYLIELAHTGLQRHRTIRGPDKRVVRRKADLQLAQWSKQWSRKKAQAEARPKRKWVLLGGESFFLNRRHAFLMAPEKPVFQRNGKKPWIFYAPTLNAS